MIAVWKEPRADCLKKKCDGKLVIRWFFRDHLLAERQGCQAWLQCNECGSNLELWPKDCEMAREIEKVDGEPLPVDWCNPGGPKWSLGYCDTSWRKPEGEIAMTAKKDKAFVQTLTTNLKSPGLGPWTVELGPKTLVLGGNGEGKSAICNALELVTTGRVTDVAGKNPAQAIELLTLMPPGASKLYVEAQLSTGEQLSWETKAKAGGGATRADPKLPSSIDPGRVLSIRPLQEAVLGSVDRARGFFLRQLTDSISAKDIRTRLADSKLEAYDFVVESLGKGLSPVEQLNQTIDKAKTRAREVKKEAQDAEGYLRHVGNSIEPATDAQLEAQRQAVQSFQAEVQLYADWENWHRSARAAEAYTWWTQAVQKFPAQVQIDFAKRDRQKRLIAAFEEILMVVESQSLNRCPMCESAVGSDHLHNRAEAFRQMRDQILAEEANQVEPTILLPTPAADGSITDQHYTRQQCLDMQRYWELQRVDPGPQPNRPGLSVEEAEQGLQQAREALAKLEASQSQWADIKKAREAIDSAETRKATWESLEKACVRVRDELLQAAIGDFTKKVQKYLPPSDIFRIDLKDGDREVFRMGFVRGDGTDGNYLHTALSGSEWARMLAAVASATARKDDLLSIVIPEERAYDPSTLQEVLKALQKAPVQVVLTSPVKPKGRIPKAWTVVEVSRLKAEARAEDGDKAEDGEGEGTGSRILSQPPAEA